jgi:hypothetical protein
MTLDRKNIIEKTNVAIEESIRNSFWGSLSDKAKDLINNVTGYQISQNDLVRTVEKPSNSKVVNIVFNSSFNNKKVMFDYESNSSNKLIHTQHEEFSLAPLEFRILTLNESIDVADYTNTFDSGFVTYNMSEVDLKDDTTSFIEQLQLAIPSMDDYIRVMMNFFDKTAKIVTIDYEKNIAVTESSNTQKKYQQVDKLSHHSQIIKTVSSNTEIINTTSLSDINYTFYINETYNVIVDKSILVAYYD